MHVSVFGTYIRKSEILKFAIRVLLASSGTPLAADAPRRTKDRGSYGMQDKIAGGG